LGLVHPREVPRHVFGGPALDLDAVSCSRLACWKVTSDPSASLMIVAIGREVVNAEDRNLVCALPGTVHEQLGSGGGDVLGRNCGQRTVGAKRQGKNPLGVHRGDGLSTFSM
jgi:hypothetical protein